MLARPTLRIRQGIEKVGWERTGLQKWGTGEGYTTRSRNTLS